MIRRRARVRWEFAAGCAFAFGAGCDVDGVTPVCPDADTCVTLPPQLDGSAPSYDDGPSADDAGDAAEGAIAPRP
jgi:hypothetical protein